MIGYILIRPSIVIRHFCSKNIYTIVLLFVIEVYQSNYIVGRLLEPLIIRELVEFAVILIEICLNLKNSFSFHIGMHIDHSVKF